MCLRCLQPLPPAERAGVYLSPRRAQIFDLIARRPGINSAAISTVCDVQPNAVKQHVHQINCLLAGTDVRIVGRGRYRITTMETSDVDS